MEPPRPRQLPPTFLRTLIGGVSLLSVMANALGRPPELAAAAPDTRSVCSEGCDHADLQKAVDAVAAGGVVVVSPEINTTCAVINKPLTLRGLPGPDGKRAHLAGGVCWGKAPLVTAAANIVIEGLEISDVEIAEGNGSCVRMDPGTRDLQIRNVYCHDSQMGLLGGDEGRLLIEDSIFESTRPGKLLSHGIYLAKGNEAVLRRTKILATKNTGHSLKAGVRKLTIEDSVIAALNEHNSRALDLYAGGEAVLRRNVIQQGPQSDNSDIIGIALEPKRLLPDGHSFLMEDNWVIFDGAERQPRVLIRGQQLGPVTVSNNVFVGLTGIGEEFVTKSRNRWFKTRKQAGLPNYDGTLRTLPGTGTASRGRRKS